MPEEGDSAASVHALLEDDLRWNIRETVCEVHFNFTPHKK